jgi:hypothetical protein
MFETKAGLSTDLNRLGVEYVQLYGLLHLLCCLNCFKPFPIEAYKVEFFVEDNLPCPHYVAYSAAREIVGRCGVLVGILLPDIV